MFIDLDEPPDLHQEREELAKAVSDKVVDGILRDVEAADVSDAVFCDTEAEMDAERFDGLS